MTEHPILFSTEMVKAILEGRKTQTRRVVKPRPFKSGISISWVTRQIDNFGKRRLMPWLGGRDAMIKHCPYGQVGDRLWVRETWSSSFMDFDFKRLEEGVKYRADFPTGTKFTGGGWKSPYHMERKNSRITLEITNIRVERVQEITEEDAKAEGSYLAIDKDDEGGFINLWDSINGKRKGCSWLDNPYVWVIEFKVIK